jgi:hypothetical protein
MSSQEIPNHEMMVVSFDDENRADEVLETLCTSSESMGHFRHKIKRGFALKI